MPFSQVYGYCMYKNGEEAKLAYPTEGFEGDVAGRSFHNGRFVQRLRQAAASVPSLTVRQAMVKRLLNGEAGYLTFTKVFMRHNLDCTELVPARLVETGAFAAPEPGSCLHVQHDCTPGTVKRQPPVERLLAGDSGSLSCTPALDARHHELGCLALLMWRTCAAPVPRGCISAQRLE